MAKLGMGKTTTVYLLDESGREIVYKIVLVRTVNKLKEDGYDFRLGYLGSNNSFFFADNFELNSFLGAGVPSHFIKKEVPSDVEIIETQIVKINEKLRQIEVDEYYLDQIISNREMKAEIIRKIIKEKYNRNLYFGEAKRFQFKFKVVFASDVMNNDYLGSTAIRDIEIVMFDFKNLSSNHFSYFSSFEKDSLFYPSLKEVIGEENIVEATKLINFHLDRLLKELDILEKLDNITSLTRKELDGYINKRIG